MNDLLDRYSFSDGEIIEIITKKGVVTVLFKQWTEKVLLIKFDYVWKLIDTNCSGHEIEDFVLISESDQIKSVANFLESEGDEEEALKLKQYLFISSSNSEVVLDIISSSITIEAV